MMSKRLFITDFDGVICDSVGECLLVTYNAYHALHTPAFQRVLTLDAIAPTVQAQFRALRPYLKGAEDFVPIFLSIEQGVPIECQQDFDRFREQYRAELDSFQAAFYAERNFLKQYHRNLWLQLNPLFPAIDSALRQQTSFDRLYILTTKRQDDVMAIFDHQGIPFPMERVLYIKADGKRQKLLELLDAHQADYAASAYIEDQVDFLVFSQQHAIGSYLVEWGYVSHEQRTVAEQHRIPIINPAAFQELLAGIC